MFVFVSNPVLKRELRFTKKIFRPATCKQIDVADMLSIRFGYRIWDKSVRKTSYTVDRLGASSYEPANRVGTNFVVCSEEKFQPGRPG